jgi:hypothetical protein
MSRYATFKRAPVRRKAKIGERRELEEMTLGEIEHLLDAEVSFWIRGRAAIAAAAGGLASCYTCGALHPYTKLDAGHYIGKVCRGVRWDLRHIRPQCTKCNVLQEGMHWLFRRRLVAEIGAAEVEDLESIAERYGESRLPGIWLIQQIRAWREKNKSLRKELKCLSK